MAHLPRRSPWWFRASSDPFTVRRTRRPSPQDDPRPHPRPGRAARPGPRDDGQPDGHRLPLRPAVDQPARLRVAATAGDGARIRVLRGGRGPRRGRPGPAPRGRLPRHAAAGSAARALPLSPRRQRWPPTSSDSSLAARTGRSSIAPTASTSCARPTPTSTPVARSARSSSGHLRPSALPPDRRRPRRRRRPAPPRPWSARP